MRAIFSEVPEALTNTLRIAEACDLKLEFGVSKYPAYTPPEGKTREEYLRELCEDGLRRTLRRTSRNRSRASAASGL